MSGKWTWQQLRPSEIGWDVPGEDSDVDVLA